MKKIKNHSFIKLLYFLKSKTKSGEEGVALITALLVMMVTSTLAIAAFYVSLHSSSSSSIYQSRVKSIDAAQAGINLAYSQLQSSSLATFSSSSSCSISGSLATSGSNATTADYQVSISYYSSLPASGTGSCPFVSSTSNPYPVAAEITSSGYLASAPSNKRTMQSLVDLTPAPVFNNAIFSNSSLAIGNHLSLSGSSSNNANIYVNQNFTCSNNATIGGNVFVPSASGTATLSNSCNVNNNVWSTGDINLAGTANIGGNAISSSGSISLTNNSSITGNASAAGTVNVSSPATVSGNIYNHATLAAPPSQPFPQLSYSSAYNSWVNAGYTLNPTTSCSAAKTLINGWYGPGGTPPTTGTGKELVVINTSTGCTLSFSNKTVLSVLHSLAVITNGSISISQNFNASSADGLAHQIAFIVPSTTDCSTGGNITIGQSVTFNSPLSTFFYTPCTSPGAITIGGHFTNSGTMYGGNIKLNNLFTMTYVSPSVPGAPPPVSNSFNVDIVYQREINPA